MLSHHGSKRMSRVVLDQINIVSGNPDASIAFYRRLGVDIPEDGVWRTPTGIHHVGASDQPDSATMATCGVR